MDANLAKTYFLNGNEKIDKPQRHNDTTENIRKVNTVFISVYSRSLAVE